MILSNKSSFALFIENLMKYTFFILIFAFVACSPPSLNPGDVFFEKGQYSEAVDAYTEYLSTHPSHTQSLYNRARSYEELKQFQKAKDDLNAIIKSDPKNINAYMSLSKIAYEERNFGKSAAFAGKAIKENPNVAQAHFLAARASHQLGYFEQATESYSNAIRINKEFGEAYLYRGAIKVSQKKMRSACEDFKKADNLDIPEAKGALKDYCR
jgi:tetratricopeptide (TPR) repeat protein